MYGWRARIGIMVPSGNTVMESELHKMAPTGVSVHTSRIHLVKTTAAGLTDMADHTARAGKELGRIPSDVIVYGCTTGSFVHGMEWEKGLQKQMEEVSGCKSVTTTGALLNALELYGKKKISIATPYIEELVELEERFFEAYGYHIVKSSGLGYDDNYVIGRLSPETNYGYAKSVVTDETELLIISCTDFRSIENIKLLEDELGIPVISSNQASMWAALRACGVKDNLEEYGSLFAF